MQKQDLSACFSIIYSPLTFSLPYQVSNLNHQFSTSSPQSPLVSSFPPPPPGPCYDNIHPRVEDFLTLENGCACASPVPWKIFGFLLILSGYHTFSRRRSGSFSEDLRMYYCQLLTSVVGDDLSLDVSSQLKDRYRRKPSPRTKNSALTWRRTDLIAGDLHVAVNFGVLSFNMMAKSAAAERECQERKYKPRKSPSKFQVFDF